MRLSRWSAKKPVLCFVPGAAWNFTPCSWITVGVGAAGRAEVEAFLLLHVLFGERIDVRVRENARAAAPDQVALAEHAGREIFDHERVGEAVDDEAREAVAFGMDQAVRVGRRVELQHVAAQRDGFADLAREESLVDRLVGIGRQHAQRDARMAVVEAAAGEIAFAIDDLDDAAGLRAHGGFLDHLLEDPGMRRAALGLEMDDGEGGVLVHPS